MVVSLGNVFDSYFFSFCYFRLTDHFKMNRAIIAVFLVFIVCSILPVSILAWGHFEMPQLVSPRNDIWETSAEENPRTDDVSLPRSGLCFWLVVPRGKFDSTNQKHLPDLGTGRVISMEFLRSFFRRHFAGKPVVRLRNVACFLKIDFRITLNEKPL